MPGTEKLCDVNDCNPMHIDAFFTTSVGNGIAFHVFEGGDALFDMFRGGMPFRPAQANGPMPFDPLAAI